MKDILIRAIILIFISLQANGQQSQRYPVSEERV